jgi:hypothetical protein
MRVCTYILLAAREDVSAMEVKDGMNSTHTNIYWWQYGKNQVIAARKLILWLKVE